MLVPAKLTMLGVLSLLVVFPLGLEGRIAPVNSRPGWIFYDKIREVIQSQTLGVCQRLNF